MTQKDARKNNIEEWNSQIGFQFCSASRFVYTYHRHPHSCYSNGNTPICLKSDSYLRARPCMFRILFSWRQTKSPFSQLPFSSRNANVCLLHSLTQSRIPNWCHQTGPYADHTQNCDSPFKNGYDLPMVTRNHQAINLTEWMTLVTSWPQVHMPSCQRARCL